MTEVPTASSDRPRWSASEAARRCGVGRATIQRALDAGRLPGAVQTDKGWQIPLEDLLAAGFKPDRPTSTGAPTTPPPARSTRAAAPSPDQAQRVAELETLLAAERARADLEHAHRIAAEQLAAERAARVDDLRHALRMIEAGPASTEDATAATTTPPPPPNEAQPPPRPRRTGVLGWILGD